MVIRTWTITLAAATAACVPDLPDTTSLVDAPRVLATRIEPAETRPGQTISTTSLWAGPEGLATEAPIDWAFCTVRKTLTESGPVSASCLTESSDALLPMGTGTTVTATLPTNGCRQFGPDRPDPEPGEPTARPTDPDGTGGYYQPIRVLADGTVSLAQARILCSLPDATREQSVQYANEYIPNAHPRIASASLEGTELVAIESEPDAVATVRASSVSTLSVAWPSCDGPPCDGSEPYLWFDPVARKLVTRREAMRVTWYATGGTFAASRTGRAENEANLVDTSNEWTAPSVAGTVYVWAVLRDDRGGAAWATYRIVVE